MNRGPIVFYDGTCGLCHGFVRLILKQAPRGSALRFAPLQGETFIREGGPGGLDSLLLLDEDGTWKSESRAVVAVLGHLGGPWAVAGRMLRAVPSGLGNRAYRWVARHRSRWGDPPADPCPRLTQAEAQRFLP